MLNDIFLFLEYLYFLTLLQLGYSGLSDLLPNIIKQQNKQTNNPPTHTQIQKTSRFEQMHDNQYYLEIHYSIISLN